MIRSLMFTIASLSICDSTYSQKNILKGKVTDVKSGTPLTGASIYIPGLKTGSRANKNGSYSTSSLALADVVNIQGPVPGPAGLIQVNVLGDYQTNNDPRGFYNSVAGTKNGFSFNAYGSFKGAHKAEEVLIPAYDLFDVGGFGFTQYHKGKTTFSGGIRMDNRHINSKEFIQDTTVKFASFTKNFADMSGSAGISYQASKALTLKLNLAREFRAPNLAEQPSNGAHEGTTRYEVGNHDLRAEMILTMAVPLLASSKERATFGVQYRIAEI